MNDFLKTQSTPRVSIAMRVHNARPFLAAALRSAFAQTFDDFELIAVDDASTDGSDEVLRSVRDPRLRHVRSENQLGPAGAANRCLLEAKGEYVAILDADDVSVRQRLAKQVAFMDTHTEIGISGGWAREIGSRHGLLRRPTTPAAIRCRLLFDSAFVHSTVIMRRQMICRHGLQYPDLSSAEDYLLFQRAADCFPMANLAERLVYYRVHSANISSGQATSGVLAQNLREIDRASLRCLGLEPTLDELNTHNDIRHGVPQQLDVAERWLARLVGANRAAGLYPSDEFEKIVAGRWLSVCKVAPGWGARKWSRMHASPLAGNLELTPLEAVVFLARVRR